ncbi:hypothetical protein [Terriglobus sp.]|uniref:hypothetical protein n=1 Tax=Terriglobus sp. TaxID=1889013 RepID=UPI003B009C81
MSDQLYLSLWFPNFRLAALPEKLTAVLQQFARVSGSPRVAVASTLPLDWHESPVFQRIFVNDDRAQESDDSLAANAVAEATEQLHDDMAYEFEATWQLWQPEKAAEGFDATWRLEPATIKVIGFGPEFDAGAYEQNGHIRVDFGLDTPWVQEEEDVDETGAERIKQNVEKLLAFVLSVEKHCGISSRLLWTESGEPLAEKLIARLQRLN